MPIALLRSLWASDVEIGVAGLRSLVILSFMWIGFRAWLLAASGWGLVVMLHSFLCLANRPICFRLALDFGGLSCVGVVVSLLGYYIGHVFAAMSWNSWRIVMTCSAAKSI